MSRNLHQWGAWHVGAKVGALALPCPARLCGHLGLWLRPCNRRRWEGPLTFTVAAIAWLLSKHRSNSMS